MGTQAYQVTKPVDPLKGGQGIIQVIVRAANAAIAAQKGAAELGVSPSLVKVTPFMTRGSVPGGDVLRYQQALERFEAGEEIDHGDVDA